MNAEVASLLDDLEKITKKMDVPEFRRRKVGWLSKNLGERNVTHPQYEEAKELIAELMKQGVR